MGFETGIWASRLGFEERGDGGGGGEEKEKMCNRSPKGNTWTAKPVALLCMVVNQNERQGSGPEGDEVL